MSERFEAIPFQPPSEELPELLRACEKYAEDMHRLCAFEWNHEELRGFSELTPLQVDRLLSR